MRDFKVQVGDRVRCIEMPDYNPIPSGMCGIVDEIDDLGTLHVHWDNGRVLGLVPAVDKFEVL